MILSAPEDEEEKEAMESKIYPKTLADFGIKDGTTCIVSDERQRLTLRLIVRDV